MSLARALIGLLLLGGCASKPAPAPAGGRCAQLIEIPEQGVFHELGALFKNRQGAACLAYHRARVPLSFDAPPSGSPQLLLTTSGIEIRRGNTVDAAWYGVCDGSPPIRGMLAPEVTHYMVRHLALTGAHAVDLRLGPQINGVDLTFYVDTLVGQGMQVHLQTEASQRHWDCVDGVAASRQETLSAADLKIVVGPRGPVFASCFLKRTSTTPCEDLKREIELAIAPSGAVTEVVVFGLKSPEPRVDACVEAAAWDLVFAPMATLQQRKSKLRLGRCEAVAGGAVVPLPSL